MSGRPDWALTRKPTTPGEMFYKEFFVYAPKTYLKRINQVGGFPFDFVTRFRDNDLYVDNDLAEKLSQITGASKQFWINCQIAIDQWTTSNSE